MGDRDERRVGVEEVECREEGVGGRLWFCEEGVGGRLERLLSDIVVS